jgi:malate/lactate dehydrogenase
MGVPVKLGSGGIEAIYELELSKDEQAMLDGSAAAVREVVDLLTS